MIIDLKPYPAMKDSGVEWLGKVPAHWIELPLKRIARIDNSGNYGGEPENGKCVLPVATTAQIDRDGHFAVDDMPRRGFSHNDADRYRCRPSDILVVKSSGSIFNVISGKAGIVDAKMPEFVFSNFLLRVVAHGRVVNPRYLFLLLSGHLTRERVKRMVTGSTYPNLRVDEYTSALLPIPPLSEQAAIVRYLNHVDRRIQRYIRGKQKLITLLEEQKQAIIHRAVTGQIDVRTGQPYSAYKNSGMEWLGKVPVHWGVMRLGRLITLTTGFPFKSEGFTQSEGDFRLLRGVNIAPGRLRWEEVVRWPVADAENFTEYQLELGDIVLGMDRPIIQDGIRVAEVGQSDLPSLLLQRVARIRPSEELDGDFALLLLNDKNFYNYLAPIFTGISVPHLSPEQIRAFRFTLPPIFEQTAIVRLLDHAATKIATAITRARREIDLLREYRTRLIADVVTGKLDVRKAVARLPDETETSQAMDRPDAHLLSTRT